MTDIAPIRGLIELQDEFTSELGLARLALKQFSDENQESLKAVATATGLVAAGIAAIGAATLALGTRGSAVNDLRSTIEEFSGSARQADAVLESLREGTRSTVDDFELMQGAAHLVSTGVKLTAAEFKTLGEAAFVLADRGLGSTKENLDLVSDALVTGRTRALAMKLGVIENSKAQDDYAASLGTTAEFLSEAGKAEANRLEVMRLLNEASKSAANITTDFGDRIDKAKTFVTNYVDELASAVDNSDVLAAGMDKIGEAVMNAFGTDAQGAVNATMDLIEGTAVLIVDIGLAAVETARVAGRVWAVMDTGMHAVVATAGFLAESLNNIGLTAVEALNAIGVVPDSVVQEFREAGEVLHLFTDDMLAQTQAASEAVVGNSEFEKTLDKMGATLFTVRDAMTEASAASEEMSEVERVHAENARILEATQKQLSETVKQRTIDETKLAEVIKKETAEILKLTQDYYQTQVEMSGTSYDAKRSQIEADFQLQVAKLDELSPLYQQHYDALRKNADAALQAIASDWSSVRDKSLEALREQAAAARETYNRMQTSGLTFTREVLEAQRLKVIELENAARGMGKAYTEAFNEAAIAAKAVADETERLRKEAEKAKAANLAMGGSFEITRANFAASARGMGADVGLVEALLKKGYSFQQAVLWSKHPDWPPPENPGPRVPGFRRGGFATRGGVAIVGEEGPEAVRLPLGAQVLPNNVTRDIMSRPDPEPVGAPVNLVFNVNGTAEETARKIKQIMMDTLRRHRQFGIA